MSKPSFAKKLISFYKQLDLTIPASLNTEVLNPYKNPETIKCVEKFYSKYFNDNRKRIFILGINPGRFGSGLTGVSFTDPVALREKCGIENSMGNKKELSSEFIYLMIDQYGGVEKFYNHFFISAVCPLGFVKGIKNYNYYDDKKLQEAVTPFIKKSLQQQIEIGARSNALIVIGADKNMKYMEAFNNENGFFKKIIALDHPRFIMQYRRKKVEDYVSKYLDVLDSAKG